MPRGSHPTPPPRVADPTVRDPTPWELAGDPVGGDVAAAEAWCRRVAASHYENFTVASRLVPAPLRQDLANVYAFARWADDLADESPSPAAAAAALEAWRGRLHACFAGRPDHPVFVALAATVRRHGLDIEPFERLLDAFEEDAAHDAAGRTVRYRTRDDLLAYCRRSADPVGQIVLALAGCRDPAAVRLSDHICSGLQLVNFWQDVRRDRAAGRVYLPADDLARHGVAEADLDGTAGDERYRALVRDEVAWARSLFDSGAPLARVAPPAVRTAVGLFLAGGRALADSIEAASYDTLAVRPTVGRWRKATLAARALAGMARDAVRGARVARGGGA